jgi:dipeptidyl aminopeptidase/acylaminoacyl peptidase
VSRPRAVLACLGLALAPAPLAARQSSDYTAPPGAPYTAEPVTVPTPMGHTLAGTLTLPAGASRSRPAAVIVTISGTGPQDRDEHLGFGGYRPFRQIADSLGRRGIAVLRMDDRGTGASKGTFKGTTHFEFAEDIRAALQYLRTRPEIDTSRIGLVGHSEGALDAAIVASKEPVVRAIVLLAGQARPLRQSLENQLRDLIRHNPRLTPAQQDSAIARTPATVDSILAADRYMRTIVLYDPSATAREVSKSAVLILTGATDRQADPTQVQEWVEAFKSSGNRDVTGHVLPNLNHLFVPDPDGSPSKYAKLPAPIRMDPKVVGMIADWLVQRLP